jgi:hypothetical protein
MDVPGDERERGRESLIARRERLGRSLRHAFPLGESGSFTGVLDAIGKWENNPLTDEAQVKS